jgi:cytochrome c553
MKTVLSAVLALFLLGCSGESESKSQTPKEVVKDEPKEVVAPEPKEEVKPTQEIKEEVDTVVENVVQEANKTVQETKEVVEEKINEVVKEVQESTPVVTDATALFRVCGGCHGMNGEKAALGKSQIIKGWEASKVEEALNGYKAGTYGGAMKGLMKSQVDKLSDADIKALAEHISKL